MGSVTLNRTRGQAEALEALGAWLMDQHYSQHAQEAIVGFAAIEGTPTGSPYLDPEDEAAASEVFVEAMGEVPFEAAIWGSPEGRESMWTPLDDRWTAAPLLAIPDELDDDQGDDEPPYRRWDPAEEEDTGEFPPPVPEPEPEPFEPSAEDWADAPDSPPIAGREARKDPAAQQAWDEAAMALLEPPYEPTDEDLADYGAWLDMLERDALVALVAPISGGAPEPAGPTPEDVATAHAWCAAMDAVEAERRAQDLRNPQYGYE